MFAMNKLLCTLDLESLFFIVCKDKITVLPITVRKQTVSEHISQSLSIIVFGRIRSTQIAVLLTRILKCQDIYTFVQTLY